MGKQNCFCLFAWQNIIFQIRRGSLLRWAKWALQDAISGMSISEGVKLKIPPEGVDVASRIA